MSLSLINVWERSQSTAIDIPTTLSFNIDSRNFFIDNNPESGFITKSNFKSLISSLTEKDIDEFETVIDFLGDDIFSFEFIPLSFEDMDEKEFILIYCKDCRKTLSFRVYVAQHLHIFFKLHILLNVKPKLTFEELLIEVDTPLADIKR